MHALVASGVLGFRGALTRVTPVYQGLDPSDVLPIKALVNGAAAPRASSLTTSFYRGRSRCSMARGGERVHAAVGARPSFQTTTKGDQISWTELRDTFAWVAQRWREQLDRARGDRMM